MQLEVSAVPVKEITTGAPEEPSAVIRERVQAARDCQQARYRDEDAVCNAELSARQVNTYCALDESCQALLERACEKYHLSMRAVSRTMKVARTIADLAGKEKIEKGHVLEALGFRNLEGTFWR